MDDSTIADQRQLVLSELLVGDERKPMALINYAGLGTLRAWVWVIATRRACHHRRSPNRELACGPAVDLLDALANNPELDCMKAHYADVARKALAEALQALTPRERNLLRFRFLDGLTLKEAAELVAVDTSTVFRQLRGIQTRVLDTTKRLLRDRLGAGDATIDSILTSVQSQLETAIAEGLRQ